MSRVTPCSDETRLRTNGGTHVVAVPQTGKRLSLLPANPTPSRAPPVVVVDEHVSSALGDAQSTSSTQNTSTPQHAPQPLPEHPSDVVTRRLTLRRGALDTDYAAPIPPRTHLTIATRSSSSTSPWWRVLCELDVSNTVRSLSGVEAALRTVFDARTFYDTMVHTLDQWRKAQWHDTVLGGTQPGRDARRGNAPTSSSTARSTDRMCLADVAKLANESTTAVAIAAAERAMATWYEVGRVERLLAQSLLLRLLDVEPAMEPSARRRLLLLRVVDAMSAHAAAQPFRLPVYAPDAPGYYRVVRDPVSLDSLYGDVYRGSVARQPTASSRGTVATSPFDYIALRERMATLQRNCHTFNGASSALGRDADALVRAGHAALRDAQACDAATSPSTLTPFLLANEELHRLFAPSPLLLQSDSTVPRVEAASVPRRVRPRAGRRGGDVVCNTPDDTAKESRRVLSLGGCAPVTQSAAPTPPTVPHTTERTRKRSARSRRRRGVDATAASEVEVVHWMRCDRCATWRVVPAPLDPLPDYWECAFIGTACDVAKLKRRQTAEVDVTGPRPRRTRSDKGLPRKRAPCDAQDATHTVTNTTHSTTETTPEVKKLRLALPPEPPTTQPTRRPRGRPRRAPPALLHTDSTSTSSSSSSYTSSSATSSSGSSFSSSSEDTSSHRPKRRVQSVGRELGIKRGRGRPRKVARSTTPSRPLTEVERELEEVEAMAVNDEPFTILRRLRQLERELTAR